MQIAPTSKTSFAISRNVPLKKRFVTSFLHDRRGSSVSNSAVGPAVAGSPVHAIDMPRATRARAARGALKEKTGSDANVVGADGARGALHPKAVEGTTARGALGSENAEGTFELEKELQTLDGEGTCVALVTPVHSIDTQPSI